MPYQFIPGQGTVYVSDYTASRLESGSVFSIFDSTRTANETASTTFFSSLNEPTVPAPSLTPEAESAVTGIEPQQLSAILYGKDIPVFVGGKMRIGGRIIEGPFFGGTSSAPTVSYIASHALCANPSGTRSITEFSLRGRVAWTSVDGALLDGLTVEFKTGSETQTPFTSSVTRYGDSAIAYRGHILSCVTDLPLSTFAGVVPFPSVLVEDSSFGDPDDGITREDALETILRYARLEDSEFEVDVTGSDIAWIIGQKVELIPFLRQLRKIFVNWNVTITDKLRIIEPGAFSIDGEVTRDNHIARTMLFSRVEPLTKPREKVYKFIDVNRDYEPNAATARQELFPAPTTSSIESETIELPIVTEASQAVADANYALFQEEVARKRLEYTGMVSLLGQEAGDGIQFDDHSHFRFRGRISETVKNAADWTIDVKAETWLNCNVEPTVIPIVERFYASAAPAFDFAFSDCDIGEEDANRVVAIVAMSVRSGSPPASVSSISIGGTNGTIHVSIANGDAGASGNSPITGAIASRVVTSGTTADITVSLSTGGAGCYIGVYSFVPTSSTPHDTASSGVFGSDPSLTIDVPNSGLVIAGYGGGGALSGTWPFGAAVWTGLSTVDYNEAPASSSGWWGSAASQTGMVSATGRIISVTAPATGFESLIAASWA